MKSIFKVRNKITGEFSSGGLYPCWVRNGGKVYTSRSAALTIVNRVLFRTSIWSDAFYINNECIAEIVEYKFMEVSVTPIIHPKK